MEFSLSIPYYAPSIPFPLPTEDEVRLSTPQGKPGAQTVVKVGQHFMVKYGSQVTTLEGENMVFIKQRTRINVPTVYAIYSDEKTSWTYIVMEYIEGEMLASVWGGLSAAVKGVVAETLRGFISELRNLAPHGSPFFGSVGRRPLLESMFWTTPSDPPLAGPFVTEEDFNDAMIRKYVLFGGSAHKAEFYRRALPKVFTNHPPTFTHGDFQRKNILVSISSDNNVSVTLLDWEKSGWLPSYWEYTMAMLAHRFDDDWNQWLERIMDPYVVEYPYLQMLQLELWS